MNINIDPAPIAYQPSPPTLIHTCLPPCIDDLALPSTDDFMTPFPCSRLQGLTRCQESKHRSQITDHRSQITDHRSQITDHRSQITDHRSQITDHRSQITDHRSQITDHRSQITDHRSLLHSSIGSHAGLLVPSVLKVERSYLLTDFMLLLCRDSMMEGVV